MKQGFKVGDYVRLKKGFYKEDVFKTNSTQHAWRRDIAKTNGKTLTVSHVYRGIYCDNFYATELPAVHFPADCFELAEPEKKPFVEVNREAKVGEWIKIVRPESTGGKYKYGDIFKVMSRKYNFIYVADLERIIYHREYVVLENYEPKKKNDDAFDFLPVSFDEINAVSEHVTLVTKTRRWTPEEIVKAKCLLAEWIIGSRFLCSFVRDGRKTTCYNPRTCKTGESKPSPDDEYNEYIGAVVAYCKTCGVKIPEFITR